MAERPEGRASGWLTLRGTRPRAPLPLGLGLSITIIGIPLLVAFLFSVRALATAEARLASLMLATSIEPAR